jgi:two-component system, LytTR family, response regulator
MNPTSPLRVIIVEDMIAIRKDIEDFLRQQPAFIVIGACGTVHDAIVLIHTTKPDLLLLDIGLPDGTGFDILEQVPAQMKVIFMTAYHEFAIRAFRYGAIDYLLKPLDENELTEALNRAVSSQPLLQEQIAITLHSYRKEKVQDYIALQSPQFVQIVELKEICYLHGDNGCTTVFLNDGKKVVTTKTLKEYEEMLSGTSFLRTHQSYMVNELYILRYQLKDGILHLKDGTQIPVSFRKKNMVSSILKRFKRYV